jgi:hypothetical protein
VILPPLVFPAHALNKATIVWLDGARPANTCIPLSFPGNTPVHLHGIPTLKICLQVLKLYIEKCQIITGIIYDLVTILFSQPRRIAKYSFRHIWQYLAYLAYLALFGNSPWLAK